MNSLIRSPPQPAPLSVFNTYTTWPGGVDPTVRLFNADNQQGGSWRRRRSASRKARKASRKARKASRKARK